MPVTNRHFCTEIKHSYPIFSQLSSWSAAPAVPCGSRVSISRTSLPWLGAGKGRPTPVAAPGMLQASSSQKQQLLSIVCADVDYLFSNWSKAAEQLKQQELEQSQKKLQLAPHFAGWMEDRKRGFHPFSRGSHQIEEHTFLHCRIWPQIAWADS